MKWIRCIGKWFLVFSLCAYIGGFILFLQQADAAAIVSFFGSGTVYCAVACLFIFASWYGEDRSRSHCFVAASAALLALPCITVIYGASGAMALGASFAIEPSFNFFVWPTGTSFSYLWNPRPLPAEALTAEFSVLTAALGLVLLVVALVSRRRRMSTDSAKTAA